MTTEAEGRRELTQHGVLCCLAGGEGEGGALICPVMGARAVPPAVTYCTACPAKELLSCELLAIPADGILLDVHKRPT